MADNLTEYLLGCDPFEPNIFKDPDHMEQELPKPFNEHTPLPWFIKRETIRHPYNDEYESYQELIADGELIADFPYESKDGRDNVGEDIRIANLDFAHHACNTYYQRDAELQRLRSQVEAMKVAGDAMVDFLEANGGQYSRERIMIDAWTASLNPTPTTEAK